MRCLSSFFKFYVLSFCNTINSLGDQLIFSLGYNIELHSNKLFFFENYIISWQTKISITCYKLGEVEALVTQSDRVCRLYDLDQWVLNICGKGESFPPELGFVFYRHIICVKSCRIQFKSTLNIKENTF